SVDETAANRNARLDCITRAGRKDAQTKAAVRWIEWPFLLRVAIQDYAFTNTVAGLGENAGRGAQRRHGPAGREVLGIGNDDFSSADFGLRRQEKIHLGWRHKKDLCRATVDRHACASEIRRESSVGKLLRLQRRARQIRSLRRSDAVRRDGFDGRWFVPERSVIQNCR